MLSAATKFSHITIYTKIPIYLPSNERPYAALFFCFVGMACGTHKLAGTKASQFRCTLWLKLSMPIKYFLFGPGEGKVGPPKSWRKRRPPHKMRSSRFLFAAFPCVFFRPFSTK